MIPREAPPWRQGNLQSFHASGISENDQNDFEKNIRATMPTSAKKTLNPNSTSPDHSKEGVLKNAPLSV